MPRTPVYYWLRGQLVTVSQFADRLGMSTPTAYYYMQKCGGNMEKAYTMAEHIRARRAARRICKIITEGGGTDVRHTNAAAAGRNAGRKADV